MRQAETSERSEQLYSAAIAELALERAARLQILAADQSAAAQDAAVAEQPREGFAREELLAAARGAGIDPAFLELALAEVDSGGKLAPRSQTITSPALTRWLGTKRRNTMLEREFDAPAERVWELLASVFTGPHSGLELGGIEGMHPAQGGVAVFRAVGMQQAGVLGYPSALAYRMHQLEVFTVQVSLHCEGARTRVRVAADLDAGMRKNVLVGRITSGLLGTMAAGLAGVGALAAIGPLAGVGLGVLAFTGIGGAMAGLWRLTYPRALAAFEVELEQLLDKVGSTLILGTQMLAAPSSVPVAAPALTQLEGPQLPREGDSGPVIRAS